MRAINSEDVSWTPGMDGGSIPDDEPFLIVIRGAPKAYKVHPKRLSAWSDYFRAAFQWNRNDGVAYVDDVEQDDFERLLLLFEDKEVVLKSVTEALSTLKVGIKFLCPKLVDICVESLLIQLAPENVLLVLHEINCYCPPEEGPSAPPVPLLAPCLQLQQECWKMVDSEADAVLTSAYLEELPLDLIRSLVKRETLAVNSEAVVSCAIVRWAKKECCRQGLGVTGGNCRKVVGDDVIFKVRYLTMTPKQFRNGPKSSKMFSQEEIRFLEAIIKKKPVFGPVPSTLEGLEGFLAKHRNNSRLGNDDCCKEHCDRFLLCIARLVDVVFG